MGGRETRGRTGLDGSPLSPAVDLVTRERKRWLFAGLGDSIDSGVGAPALVGEASIGETALLGDMLAIASVRSATRVICVQGEDSETVLSSTGGTQIILRYDQSARFCLRDGYADSTWITRLSTVYRNDADWTQIPAVGDGEWSNQAILAREKTLTLSRGHQLMLEAGLGLLPIAEPFLLYGVTTARASRPARAIAADPDSGEPQSADRGT